MSYGKFDIEKSHAAFYMTIINDETYDNMSMCYLTAEINQDGNVVGNYKATMDQYGTGSQQCPFFGEEFLQYTSEDGSLKMIYFPDGADYQIFNQDEMT